MNMLTMHQVASQLDCTYVTACTLARAGEFPNARKRGNKWLVPDGDILDYKRKHPVKDKIPNTHTNIGISCNDVVRKRILSFCEKRNGKRSAILRELILEGIERVERAEGLQA